jgi:hypothetical protein
MANFPRSLTIHFRPSFSATAADLDVHAEVGPDVEGRVDVDQLDAPLSLDLLAQRPVLEARQNQLVSPPDQLVGPALELPPPVVHRKQQRLMVFPPGLTLRPRRLVLAARLVHVLDRLKGQHDVRDLVGLAVPNQLDLPFVVKQQESVLLRQRLVGFEVADDVLIFSVGQSGHQSGSRK